MAEYIDVAPDSNRKQEDKKKNEAEVKKEDSVLEYHVSRNSEVKIE